MKNKKYWFEPKKHSGWKKDQKISTRRWKLIRATDKRMTWHNRYLQAARMIQALANVTTDQKTRKLAKLDAAHFFKKAEETPT